MDSEAASRKLDELGRELNRLRSQLTELAAGASDQRARAPQPAVFGSPPTKAIMVSDDPVSSADVRRLIRLRRERDGLFDEGLFADPAWDVLLELYAAHLEGNRVSISSACIAATVPGTTALRWITTLVDRGLVTRQDDQFDRRRSFVSLTPRAREKMAAFFTGLYR